MKPAPLVTMLVAEGFLLGSTTVAAVKSMKQALGSDNVRGSSFGTVCSDQGLGFCVSVCGGLSPRSLCMMRLSQLLWALVAGV